LKKNKDTKSKDEFDPDSGIKILQINNDGTLIVKVFLDYKDFSTFYVDTTKITIGITISELYKYLKSINDNDILILSIEKNNKQNLILEAYNEKNCSKNECLLKLLDLNNEKKIFNECELEFVITMSTAEFNKICKEFAAISEYIEIICSASEIIFQTKGDSLIRKLSFQNCSEKKTQDGVHIDTKIADKTYTVELIFLLEYLTRFNKCTQLSDKVMLYLRQNSPIFIQYQIASIGNLIIANSPTKQDNHI
jgi:proliferating cell nuclear antigen